MRRFTKYIVVHCSATKSNSDIGLDEIDDWHRARGWDGCGYHAVIRRSGLIEYGRHFDRPGAHVKGFNTRSVGICMVGGVDHEGKGENNFTADQFMSLKLLLIVMKRSYPNAEILGHRDLSPDLDGDGIVEEHEWLKECPSFDVRRWMKSWQQSETGSETSG